MRPRTLYLALCIVGAVLPYSQFIGFWREDGRGPRLFVQQLFVNRVSGFFAMDVLVSSLVLVVFVVVDGRRLGLRHRWAPIAAVLLCGVSLGLPLFLYLREARLDGAGGRGS
jgi:hypothetical protein